MLAAMLRTGFMLMSQCALAALPLAVAAQESAELADLSARVDYGFYSEQPRILRGARDEFARMDADDPAVEYWSAYAALRAAQLQLHEAQAAQPALDQCIRQAQRAGGASPWRAEAAILVAACSDLAAKGKPLTRLLHERRRDQALQRAAGEAPDNPRLALVEVWATGDIDEKTSSAVQSDVEAKLGAALDEFATIRPPAEPAWGEADVCVRLGALYLARGDTRRARDMIEEALLAAPDYAYALRLQARLTSSR
jgi:tetratricopeptide (TPR) repeat protein